MKFVNSLKVLVFKTIGQHFLEKLRVTVTPALISPANVGLFSSPELELRSTDKLCNSESDQTFLTRCSADVNDTMFLILILLWTPKFCVTIKQKYDVLSE